MRQGGLGLAAVINVVLRVGLILLAFISVFASIALTLVALSKLKGPPTVTDASALIADIAYFLSGWVIAAILIGLAMVLQWQAKHWRQQHDQAATLHALTATMQRLEVALALQSTQTTNVETLHVPAARHEAPASEAAERMTPAAAEHMLALLGQIRDLTLLTEAQRQILARSHAEEKRQQHQKLTERYIATGQWAAAQKQIDALRQALPDDPLVAQLTEKLSAQRGNLAKSEVESARAHIVHLMSITAWPQAEEALQSLRQRYAGEPQVEALAAEVQRERDAFEKENFSRLLMELRDATDRREWRRAYVAAQELIRRYPHDRKVEKLKGEQLATIRENAESQERKEEEALFKDLLQRQRYDDAATVARRVIEKYPASSSAVELAKLLPKVEELIRQETMKRTPTLGDVRL